MFPSSFSLFFPLELILFFFFVFCLVFYIPIINLSAKSLANIFKYRYSPVFLIFLGNSPGTSAAFLFPSGLVALWPKSQFWSVSGTFWDVLSTSYWNPSLLLLSIGVHVAWITCMVETAGYLLQFILSLFHCNRIVVNMWLPSWRLHFPTHLWS